MSAERKILLSKQSIALFCLLLIEVCSSENFQIVRTGKEGDSFTIPPTKCDENNDTFDYCGEYNATRVGRKRCECVCHKRQATFSVHRQSWSCLKNEDARMMFGCNQPIFFDKEKGDDQLSLLRSGGDEKIDLTRSNCRINTISSWYMDCDRKKDIGASMENIEIEEGSRDYDLEVGNLQPSSPLLGRIINLGINCSPQGQQPNQNYCLLFKLEGKTSCPVTVTQPTIKTSTVVDMVSKSAPPEVFTPPREAADQRNADNAGMASPGLIVGVTVGVILTVLLVATLIYRRHNERKHPRTISEDQSSQSDSGSQPRDQNEGYETLSAYRSTIYTSNYHVPNGGGSEDERTHLRSPRAPSSSEGLDNNGLDSEEPFYSTVEELCSECSGKPGEYVDPATSERSRDFRPFSIEQRVYNMMEVLNTYTSESPYDYGSNEGNKDHVPLSLGQRASKMIEVQNTDPSESSYEYVDPASSEKPRNIGPLSVQQGVYNMMEGLNTNTSVSSYEYVDPASSERSRDFHPFSMEQRVYNMMEVLNTNTSESSSDYSSNEGNKDNGPLSVEQRASKMTEVQNTDTSESSYEYVDPASSEKPRNISPLSVQQGVYNMMEGLNTNTSESSYEYVDPASSERSRDFRPFSMEQRVYNMMEVLNTTTSESSSDYSSNEGNKDNGPLSVEQRESKMIEVQNTDPSESSYEYVDPALSEKPRNIGPLSVQQGVYNMMEDLNPNTSESSYEYVDPASSERSRDFRPFSVEQCAYNMMEVLNNNTSESPYDYGSNEGNKDNVPLSVEKSASEMTEVQNTDISESSYEYVDPTSSERPRNIGPLSVEQRVYHMMEDLNTNTSESPYDFASNEWKQNDVPLSVEQLVYNLIEAFDAVTEEEPNSSDPKKTPVYNVLEEPLPKGGDDIEKSCSRIVEDPVHNILEGPDQEKIDNLSDDTLYNTKQQDNNSNTFLYAVVA